MTSLHDEDTLELGNIDVFLDEFRARFKYETHAQKAELEIQELRRGSQPVAEYI